MSEIFNKCIEIILKNEGGYVNHPKDPGGETKYGIAKRFFPDEDIKNLTIDRAKELYYSRYWLKMNIEGINSHEAVLQVFDFGVNAGTRTAIKRAQQIALVKVDGICGPNTLKAINNYAGDFVEDYKHVRRVYYESLANRKHDLEVFLRGWLNRVDHTHF